MNILSNLDYGKQINLLHSLVAGPLLAWTGYRLSVDKSVSSIEKMVLLVAGIGIILFHGYKAMQHQKDGDSILVNYGYQVNALHFFFIGPLVAWIGYKLTNGKNVTDLEKSTMLFLGVAAMIYHGYKVAKSY